MTTRRCAQFLAKAALRGHVLGFAALVIVTAVWIGSYSPAGCDFVHVGRRFDAARPEIRLFAEDGSLGFCMRRYAGSEPIRVKGDEDDGMVTLWHPVRSAFDIDWERVGFGIFIGQMSNGVDRWSVKGFEIPCWAMAFVSAAVALICWRRARKRARGTPCPSVLT